MRPLDRRDLTGGGRGGGGGHRRRRWWRGRWTRRLVVGADGRRRRGLLGRRGTDAPVRRVRRRLVVVAAVLPDPALGRVVARFVGRRALGGVGPRPRAGRSVPVG